MSDYFSLHLFQELITLWYKKNGRMLVWRETLNRVDAHGQEHGKLRDPYYVLVAEMMLQQTQVSTVIPKYNVFLTKWPTIFALAGATLSDVVIMWKGLGYNRRAKHLFETAKLIVHTCGGKVPSDTESLRKLPGIGPYMVSALRVFAFGKQDAVIDVNVKRVLTRAIRPQVTGDREMREIAEQSIPKGKSDEWHQALMDFGAVICTAKKPRCLNCPVSRICRSNLEAKKLGFTSFADWLGIQPTLKKRSKKDQGKKFEETDRYFRGRVIDFLRTGEKSMVSIQSHMLTMHKLHDRKRFGVIVESLVVDGLITVRGTTVSLA